MGYKAVPDGMHLSRRILLNRDSSCVSREVTPNLAENELKITFLGVKDCPIDRFCVFLIDGVSSICTHMGRYAGSQGSFIFEKLLCKHDIPLYRKVEVFEAEKCPGKTHNCVGCVHLENVIIPLEPNPKKSHACVVCKLAEGDE